MPGVKGKTNNPNGRPRTDDCAAEAIRKALKDRDWRAMAQSLYSVLVVEKDGDLVSNPATDGKQKAAAYNALADRAFGKPVQRQIVQTEIAPPIDKEALDAVRRAMVGELPHDEPGVAP
jgi:hypothetical protein